VRSALALISICCLASTASAEGERASASDATGRSIEPSVEIETPYVNSARPRPKGEVDAAVQDENIARWNVGGTGDPNFISNRAGYHPATRVKVDSRVLAGTLAKKAPLDKRTGKHRPVLSETSLLARSRKYGYWPFRLCFEQGVHENASLRGGESIVQIRVDTSGRVTSSRLISTKLKDSKVADCIAERARDLPLLKPPSAIDVELKVSIWPGDAPLPSLEKSSEPVDAPFRPRSVAETLKTIEPSFVECLSDGLLRDPSLWGRVQIHVEVDANGSVRIARENESRFPDRDVSACVVRAIKQLTFSASSAHGRSFEVGVRLGQPPIPSVTSP